MWRSRWRGRAWAVAAGVGLGLSQLIGCSAPSLLLGAAGVASDTSIPWAVIKHLHAKLTEGDDTPCMALNSLERGLSPRCGAFVPGSLNPSDIRSAQWQGCPLAIALADRRLWPVVPELLDKGAQPESCGRSPLVDLARVPGEPDFTTATPAVLASIRWLAQADARSIQPEVVRLLSSPGAQAVGLDAVLLAWLDQGELDAQQVPFGVLGALDPRALTTSLGRVLEARGHTARGSLGGDAGAQAGGFETALRTSNWAALDWWLSRVPALANQVPPTQGMQLPWVPLARVLAPGYLAQPQNQGELVEFLIAHGARASQHMPYDPSSTVLSYARSIHSPMVALLEAPRPLTVAARDASLQP